MTRTKKIRLIVIAAACLFFSLVTAIAINAYAAGSDEFVFSGLLEPKYKYGDTVEIPTATYNGKEVDFVVNLPDGTSTRKSSVKLSKTGVYTVNYIAKKANSNEYIKKVLSFSVFGQMFTVNGSGYTEYKTYSDRIGGLYAKLEKGDSLVYNGIIDLNRFDAGQMLFKMGIPASTPGEADIEGFEVTLSDIYDESIFVTFRFKKFKDGGEYETIVSYYDVGFGTVYAGLETSDVGPFTYVDVDGKTKKFKAHINSEKYGAHSSISMTGGTAADPFDGDKLFGVSYDMFNGYTYVKLSNYGGTPYYPVLVSDLYNENIYGERFKGFTDGKVKLTITPTKFLKNDCSFFFAEVGGTAIGADNWNKLETETAPMITVDMGEYTVDTAPSARLGASYRIFDAKAYDLLDGQIDYDVKVYYGYSNLNKIRVNVTDNSFKTANLGEYTIEYSATNSIGNKSVVTVKVNCVELNDKISLSLTNEYDYGAVNAGETVKLFDAYEIKNALGNAKLNVECKLDGGDVVYTLDENYSFVPYYAGVYSIRYAFSDFATSDYVEKKLTVNKADVVYYETLAELPQYLIKNGKYNLDFVKAYSVASGKPEEVPVKVSVRNDGSEAEVRINGDYIVSAKAKAELVFVADVDFDVEALIIERAVKDVGLGDKINKSALFVPTTDGISFVGTSSSIDCLFDGSVQNAKFVFANTLVRHTFKFSFAPYSDGSAYSPFESFNMYLCDYMNANKKVKISFFRKDDGRYLGVNDAKTIKVAGNWNSMADMVTIDYDISSGKLSAAGNSITVESFYGLSEKVSFDKGLTFVGEINGIGTCKGISLYELNGQNLTDNKYDYIPPQIDTTRADCFGEKDINTLISVGDFFASDVVSPYTRVVYSVKGPDGKLIVSNEGVVLNEVDGSTVNTFVLKNYGNYYVTITAIDQNNNDLTISYRIIVTDYTLPTIKLTDKITSGKANSAIDFAKYTVGNDKGSHTTFITVLDPTGSMTYYGEKTSFTPTKKGVYTVTVSVVDKNGNLAEASYTVTVS